MGGISISFSIWRKITQKVVYSSGDPDYSPEQVSKWSTFSIFFTLLSILDLICSIFEFYNERKSSLLVVIRFSSIFVQFVKEYRPFFCNFHFSQSLNFFETFFGIFAPKTLGSKFKIKKSQINPGKD